ncbi:FAD-dependent monooxygenase [Tropicimonas sp.]|uniref:FAD-dependent monooxygenase n=1 Tax=Tropicimonas sp. TaxID=2067044 RepID=UPI003A850BA4
MSLTGQEIIVLGAGIGGLAAARALAMRGARVAVIERAPAITEVGAGIQVSPNGGAVLNALGLGEAFGKISVSSRGAVLRDYRHGDEVLRLDLAKYGRFGLVHRADLIGLLEQGARDAGVDIRTGQNVSSVDLSGDRPVLNIDGGAPVEAPLLVGADGLHSRVRAALLGPETAVFTGNIAWRALLPVEPGAVPDEAQVFMGPGKHLVAYPLRDGTVLNLVGTQERKEWLAEGWNHKGDPFAFREIFRDFGQPVRGWLERVENVMVWGLFRHQVAPHWYRSGAALLGDAAHPTLPFLAQGACMALEDAWVLAESLAEAGSTDAAMARYQTLRKPRCRRIVDAATANARNYHLRSAPVRMVAHTGLRLIQKASPRFMADRFAWLYTCDVTAR